MQEKNILLEELTDKQKKVVDKWPRTISGVRQQHDGVFGKGKDKVILPFQETSPRIDHDNLHLLGPHGSDNGSKIARVVADHLQKHGYKIHDYHAGLCTKEGDNRHFKIGSILARNGGDDNKFPVFEKQRSVTEAFNMDPHRKAHNTPKEIVISRHPYDVAGMSTDRDWTSCSSFDNKGPAYRKLPGELEHGTLSAYLVKKGDHDIRRPFARVNIKRFESGFHDSPDIFRPDQRHYGANIHGFKEAVNSWSEKHYPDGGKEFSIHNKTPDVYNDDGRSSILKDKTVPPEVHETAKSEIHHLSKSAYIEPRGYDYNERRLDDANGEDIETLHDNFDHEMRKAARYMTDEKKKQIADHFSRSSAIGHRTELEDASPFNSKIHYNGDKHGVHDDHYNQVQYNPDDGHHLLAVHVARNPHLYADHATNPANFAHRLYEIHRNNEDEGYEEDKNKSIYGPDVHHFMMQHLGDKQKETMGENETHSQFEHELSNITDPHYLRGLTKSRVESGPKHHHSYDDVDWAEHAMKHGDEETVHSILHDPKTDWFHSGTKGEEHDEMAHEVRQHLGSTAMDRIASQNASKTKTQVYDPKWMKVMSNLKESQDLFKSLGYDIPLEHL